MFSISGKGDFSKTLKFLNGLQRLWSDLDQYGRMGVDALAKATPVESGLTARSWAYRIIKNNKRPGIEWYNTNVVDGIPVVILIQYSHGTGTGGYVQGRDFINPAIRPVFDRIAADVWRKVVSS